MKIRFLLAKNPSPLAIGGDFIQWVEKVSYSHCAILIEASGIAIVYESLWPKSRKVSFDKWLEKYEIVQMYSFDVPENKVKPLVEDLESLVSRFYSVPQLVLIGLSLLNDWFERISRAWILNHRKGLICTELVAIILSSYFTTQFSESLDRVGLKDCELALDHLKELERRNDGSLWLS